MFSKWLSVRLKEIQEKHRDEVIFAAFTYYVVTTVVSVAIILNLFDDSVSKSSLILALIFVAMWAITCLIPSLIFIFKKLKNFILAEYIDYTYFKETGKRKKDVRIIDEDGNPVDDNIYR